MSDFGQDRKEAVDARSVDRLSLSWEGAAAFAVALTIYIGAVLYFLGKTFLNSSLEPYGLQGALEPDVFETMRVGAEFVPELMAIVFGVFTLMGWLIFRKEKAYPRLTIYSILLSPLFALSSVPIVKALVMTAPIAQASVRFQESHRYEIGEGSIIGNVVASDTTKVVIAVSPTEAVLLNWDEISRTSKIGD